MKIIGLLLSFQLLTLVCNAQQGLDGTYYGKFEQGGFQDSIIISDGSLFHVLNKGWGYGIENQYVYSMINLENDLYQLKQTGFLRERIAGNKNHNKGIMHMQQLRITKLDNGDIQLVSPSHPNNPCIFEIVAN